MAVASFSKIFWPSFFDERSKTRHKFGIPFFIAECGISSFPAIETQIILQSFSRIIIKKIATSHTQTSFKKFPNSSNLKLALLKIGTSPILTEYARLDIPKFVIKIRRYGIYPPRVRKNVIEM